LRGSRRRSLPGLAGEIYLVFVSPSSLTPEELRAAAEVHSELGPGYSDAVVDSFLEKVGREIDARVDARLADGYAGRRRPAPRQPRDNTFALAVISMALGIPMTVIVLDAGPNPPGFWGLLVVWVAIVSINVGNAVHNRARTRGY
jgi:hypothetical protein